MKLIKKVLILLALLVSGLSIGATLYIFTSVPVINFDKKLAESTKLYDSKDILLDEIHGEEHRILVNSDDISPDLKKAVIAIEDKNFYRHQGVSVKGVIRAFIKGARNGWNFDEGASTIEMQLAKNLNGNIFERNLANKIIETVQAIKLNRTYSKEAILTKYFNVVYWGNNTYGVEAAANTYFGKSANELELHEAAMMAALIQNPSRFDPYKGDYGALKARQKDVLKSLFPKQPDLVEKYSKEPLVITGKTTWQKSLAPFVTEAAIKEVKNTLNLTAEELETNGYKIYTTVDKVVQDKAIKAVEQHSAWKGEAQIALVSIDPATNKILATVGSKDFDVSPLNRSLESERQPGSAIKPFVYYTGIEYGLDRNYTIVDEEYCIPMTWQPDYCPRNYGGGFAGEDTIYNHLIKSRNIPAVKVGQMVGISNVINNMKDLGITTKLDAVPSFPLGANDVIPVEIANAYAAFANGGYINTPTIIEKVIDKDGNILIDNTNRTQTKVLNSDAVAELNAILYGVVEEGTGTKARIEGVISAGKTGTTDGQADVWYIGYTEDISTAVWIGNDNYHRKLPYGATGGGWAAPIWRDFTYYYYN